MKIYLTYFRYDRDEDYSIYHIDLNKKNSIKHYKEEDLPHFLSMGPDDVSVLVLQEVEMSKSEFNTLLNLYQDSKDCDTELIDFMIPIYDRTDNFICYDGCDTLYEIIDFFIDSGKYNLDNYFDTSTIDPDDLKEKVVDLLFEDDNLFDKVMKDYIDLNY